jgi:hypothetical protein
MKEAIKLLEEAEKSDNWGECCVLIDKVRTLLREKPKCSTCKDTGEVDDTIHSVNAGIDINKPCPTCGGAKETCLGTNEQGIVIHLKTGKPYFTPCTDCKNDAAEFVKDIKRRLTDYRVKCGYPSEVGNYVCSFDIQKLINLIKQLKTENERLHKEKLFWVDAGHYEMYVQEKYKLEQQIAELQAKLKEAEDDERRHDEDTLAAARRDASQTRRAYRQGFEEAKKIILEEIQKLVK